MPKVSIVVPIYNVAGYLPATVQSALKQTEKDIEIILVDDGSPDESGRICDAFAREDSRIHVLHQENSGLSAARNAGIQMAQGEYILLLDGDDRLHPGAVERTLTVIKATEADFVQFRYREVKKEEQPGAIDTKSAVTCGYGSGDLFRNLYALGGVGASACTKLFPRSLLLEIPFESIQHEDEQWCTRAFSRDLTAAYIDDVLYDYVVHENSFIHGTFRPSRLDVFRVKQARIQVLKDLGLTEFLDMEYRTLFLAVLRLYVSAAEAKDKTSLRVIRSVFKTHKEAIAQYASLNSKFRLLFRLMCLNFNFIALYRFYWRFRRNTHE